MGIETMTTRLAIQRISDRQLEQLRVIHDLFMQSAKARNYVKMAFYDEELHHKIAEASGNELLIRMEKIIAECIVDYRVQTYLLPDNADHAITTHEALIGAFEKARRRRPGVALMTEHTKTPSRTWKRSCRKRNPERTRPRPRPRRGFFYRNGGTAWTSTARILRGTALPRFFPLLPAV